MTVHSLPQPGEEGLLAERRTRSGRLKMIALLLVCAAPVLASYFTYYVIRPDLGGRNFGDLIEPPVPMPAALAQTALGQARPLESLKGQWLLLTVGGGACDRVCENNLYFQRQLRESQGKDKDRIDRVWLVSDDAPVSSPLQTALQGGQILRVKADILQSWLQPAAGHALADHLYVVDPMGNWMLRFPPDMDVHSASKARRDLDRLMRASSFWDQPGR